MNKQLGSGDISDVFKVIRPAKDKWERIALNFKLSRAKVDEIKASKEGDPSKCLYAVLNAWLAGRERSTWTVVVRTLRHVGEENLAEQIQKEKSTKKRLVAEFSPQAGKHFKTNVDLGIQDLSWFLVKLKPVAPEWFSFGVNLKLQLANLRIIQKDTPECEDCLRKTLVQWLEHDPVDPERLVEALESIGKQRLSSSIKQDLIQGEHRKDSATPSSQTLDGNRLEQHLRSHYTKQGDIDRNSWPPSLEVQYVNLVLVKQAKIPTCKHQIKVANLAKRGDVEGAVQECEALALKDITNYSDSRKVIIIEGAPGIGKTTLALKLRRDWANREMLTDYFLLLYIPLRVPLMRVAESVEDVLNYFAEHCTKADVELIKRTEGKGVIFVLDGWDELRPSCRLPDSFFPKLIRGEFLHNCSVIVTSRPGTVSHILRQSATRLIEILGFTEEQVHQFIHSYFKEDEGIAEKLIDDLHEYPNVGRTCYVAINLTILCFVYRANDHQLPPTLTQVYELFVLHAIKRHLIRSIEINDDKSKCTSMNIDNISCVKMFSGFEKSVNVTLEGLGKLALKGLENGDFSFSSNDIAKFFTCGIENPSFDGFGLLKILFVFRMHGAEYLYNFLHLTVQEYLAAYTVFLMPEQEQSDWFAKELEMETFQTMLNFFHEMKQNKTNSVQETVSRKNASPTTAPPTTASLTSAPPTTAPPTAAPPTTAPPTSTPPTTAPPTSTPPTSAPPTTAPPTSAPPITGPLTTGPNLDHNISHLLKKEPELNHLMVWLKDIKARAKRLGTQLKVSEDDMAILPDLPQYAEQNLNTILENWRRKMTSPHTFEQLFKALELMEEIRLLSDIKIDLEENYYKEYSTKRDYRY